MKKLFAIAIVAGIAFLSVDDQEARAQGVHFGVGGVHVDVGRPHGAYGYQSFYSGGHFHRGGHGGGWGAYRGHSDWHDTSHYDYHPGRYQRHFNHFDYRPSHYDYHSQGHRDRHH